MPESSPPTRFRLRPLIVLVVLTAWLAGGCVKIGPVYSKRGTDQLGPFPTDFHEIVYRWIEDEFVAVATVRSLDMTTPAPGVAEQLFGEEPVYGWYSKLTFRATDGSGAQTGKLYYAVLIKNQQVVKSRKMAR